MTQAGEKTYGCRKGKERFKRETKEKERGNGTVCLRKTEGKKTGFV